MAGTGVERRELDGVAAGVERVDLIVEHGVGACKHEEAAQVIIGEDRVGGCLLERAVFCEEHKTTTNALFFSPWSGVENLATWERRDSENLETCGKNRAAWKTRRLETVTKNQETGRLRDSSAQKHLNGDGTLKVFPFFFRILFVSVDLSSLESLAASADPGSATGEAHRRKPGNSETWRVVQRKTLESGE